jgi:NitT/TauT family transport system substrate-binding protein
MVGRLRRLAAIGAVAALVSTAGAASAAGTTAVVFRLDTNFLPKHGISFAAEGLGFYKQQGLSVTFQPSTGSYDTSIAVGQGRADFGFADIDTMVKAEAAGAPVEQLATIHAVNPSAVITLPQYNLHRFQDLKGKKIAGEPAGATTILFPLALQLCHMSMTDVDFISVDSRAKLPGLQAGRWQAFVAYSVSDPATMIGEGLTPVVIPYSTGSPGTRTA